MLNVRRMIDEDLVLVDDEYQRRLYAWAIKENSELSLAIEDEQGVLCLCGCIIRWRGVGEIWLKLVRVSQLKSLIKELRRLLQLGAKKFDIRRLHAFVDADFDKGIRFIEFLGFEREGLLKRFSYYGKDQYIYARLF